MLRLAPKTDVIFCHMFPEFTIMAAPFAKLFGKPLIMWYTHGHVSLRLKLAHFLATKVTTASKGSFKIKSNKVVAIGHGIDTSKFKPSSNFRKRKKTILSVGRISPIKDYETFIKAANVLVNEKDLHDLDFIVVGGPATASDREYYTKIKLLAKNFKLNDYIKFIESVPYSNIVNYYQLCDVFVSTSNTGSLDKVVLEAMACEKPTLVCNEAFEEVFGEYSSILMFSRNDFTDLADKIIYILQMDENQRNEMCHNLRKIVEKMHSIESLTDNLVDVFKKLLKERQK